MPLKILYWTRVLKWPSLAAVVPTVDDSLISGNIWEQQKLCVFHFEIRVLPSLAWWGSEWGHTSHRRSPYGTVFSRGPDSTLFKETAGKWAWEAEELSSDTSQESRCEVLETLTRRLPFSKSPRSAHYSGFWAEGAWCHLRQSHCSSHDGNVGGGVSVIVMKSIIYHRWNMVSWSIYSKQNHSDNL